MKVYRENRSIASHILRHYVEASGQVHDQPTAINNGTHEVQFSECVSLATVDALAWQKPVMNAVNTYHTCQQLERNVKYFHIWVNKN